MTGVLAQLAIVLAATLGILGVILGVGIVGRRNGLPPEVQRKAVHVATGLFAIALPFLVTDRWPVVCLIGLGIVVMAAMRIPALAGGFGSALHGVSRKSYGEILLALAVGFIYLRSRGNLILYTLPISVITLSDTAAALAGTSYGRRLFKVERGTKSVEGVTVFFLITWIVAMSMLLLFTDIPRINVFLLGITVAGFGAIVEMDSWRGLDNLFVPIAVHFFLQGYLNASETNVLGLSATFLGTILLVMLWSPYLRFLTPHAARAYCVAAFLLVGISGPLAAILPIVSVMAHVAARSVRPCRSEFPDLDLLATLSAAALIWLIVGESIGPSAIDFFKMSFLGMILVYAAITARGHPWIMAAAGGLLLAAYVPLVAYAPAYSHWHPDLTLLSIASVLGCGLAYLAWPRWFDRWRAPRTAALASAVPLISYLALTLP